MDVRTMLFAAVGCLVALMHLVVIRVVLLFFPSVAVEAPVLEITTVTVGLRLLLCAPEAALLLRAVVIYVRLASVVLPIVRVLTLVTHVALHLVIERAPDRLKVEHVKVSILLHLV